MVSSVVLSINFTCDVYLRMNHVMEPPEYICFDFVATCQADVPRLSPCTLHLTACCTNTCRNADINITNKIGFTATCISVQTTWQWQNIALWAPTTSATLNWSKQLQYIKFNSVVIVSFWIIGVFSMKWLSMSKSLVSIKICYGCVIE